MQRADAQPFSTFPAAPPATGSAPGKVILLGEHGVVYGYPALACAIPRFTRVQCEWYDGPNVLVSPFLQQGAVIPLVSPSASAPAALFHFLFHHFQVPTENVRVRVDGDLPVGRGLGSSASLSVAAIRAVSAFVQRPISPEALLELGLEAEKHFHGTPSGLDHTTVVFEGVLLFQQGRPPRRIVSPAPFELVVLDSGGERQTGAMVAGVRERLKASPALIQSLLESIREDVEQAVIALESGDLNALGQRMNHNQLQLQALGVSTPRLEALVTLAREAGALGAKLSGAGGGGVVVALALTGAHRVLEAAREAGVPAFSVRVNAPAGS